MNKIITFTIILSVLCSCGQKPQKEQDVSRPHFQDTFLDVVLDSNSTWQQILDAAGLFTDSLCIIAVDTMNGNYRLAAQGWGYMTIYLLSDLYNLRKDEGEDVSFSEIRPILDRINKAASVWLTTETDENLYIWRDHFYNSHQKSGNSVKGYFNFMIKIPKSEPRNKTMRITFPTTTDKSYQPTLAFTKRKEVAFDEEIDYEASMILDDEIGVHPDTDVMYADLEGDVVDNMNNFDAMYVMFQSTENDDGDPVEMEITRVELSPFQEKWKSVMP